MKKYSFAHLARYCKIPCVDYPRGVYTGAAVDTKKIEPGNLFFALRGARTDGHHYLEEAATKGASLLVIRENYQGNTSFSCPILRVPDPLIALQNHAQSLLEELRPTICAITGSYGKTTTKSLLEQMLAPYKKTMVTPSNHNSQIGLPLSIINHLAGDETHCILEMGLTEKGHIERLVQIAPPDIAMILAVAHVHIQQFENIDALAQAKKEIFSHPRTKCALVGADTLTLETLLSGSPTKKMFSLQHDSAHWGMKVNTDSVIVREEDEWHTLPKPSFSGSHFYYNLLGAIAAARSLGLSWEEISHTMQDLQLPERRLQEVKKQGISFVDDAYNAAEDSTKAALTWIASQSTQGRKIAILGELSELGKFSEETHRRVGLHALECVDEMVCFGKGALFAYDEWNKRGKTATYFDDMDALIAYLKNYLSPGDLVLLKGSRGNRLERILEAY